MEDFVKHLKAELDTFAMEIWGRPVPKGAFCVCHGNPVDMASFRDEASKREYRISKLCQVGQDDFFGRGEG